MAVVVIVVVVGRLVSWPEEAFFGIAEIGAIC